LFEYLRTFSCGCLSPRDSAQLYILNRSIEGGFVEGAIVVCPRCRRSRAT
jgi:hypothetical protein